MPRKAPWSPTEDAIIRENAEMGPSWEGYALLLPGRTQAAIMKRRQALGVSFKQPRARKTTARDEGGWGRSAKPAQKKPKPKAKQKPKRRELPPDDGSWTNEQIEQLVRCALTMTEWTGHSLRDCVFELARVVRAYRRGNLESMMGDE